MSVLSYVRRRSYARIRNRLDGIVATLHYQFDISRREAIGPLQSL